HPRHIKRFSQALVSRFLSGMVVKVDRPDRETRLELIRRLADARSLPINDAAMETIAARCVGSVRELEGAITKLAALRSLPGCNGHGAGHEVGLVLTEQLFSDHGWQPATPVRMSTVIEIVCQRLGISQTDLMGSGRHRRVVLGRALVAFLGRQLTTQSYPEIAQSIGRTYHSTVHTAAQRLRRQLEGAESVELGGPEARIDLQELVDELRHDILRATAGRP
ncbi:MAG: helix-turn-helix domain-containing protein, partial [Planctomycetota bacterium]